MKRTLSILVISLLAGALCLAAPVDRNKAARKAADVLGTSVARTRQVFNARATMSTQSADAPAYYIFNNEGGGFAIIAGDDCIMPVLGYSATGHIDANRIPENMLFWLGRVSKTVGTVRSLPLRQSAAVAEAWSRKDSPLRAGEEGGKLLDVPTWSQENPYNWYCPFISKYEEERSITGCVATAAAMVMRFHEWPPCGHGTLPDYSMEFMVDDYNSIDIPIRGHELGHEYKWSIMPKTDIYSSTKNPTEGERQVAWLMYDCGIMFKAMYSFNYGTSAYTSDLVSGMNKYMYYKKSTIVYKDNYSDAEWVSLIKAQIDKDLPVIYGGSSAGGGHQFIVCGYDKDDKLYVNWGWGGDCNAYFAVDNFAPYYYDDLSYLLEYGYTQEEIDEYKAEIYDSDIDAVINLEPDKSVTPTPVAAAEPERYVVADSDYPEDNIAPLYLKAGTHKGHEYYGIYRSDASYSAFHKGETTLLNAGLITNSSSQQYNGWFRFDHLSYDGKFVETLGAMNKSIYVKANDYYYIYDVSCTVRSDVRLGDKICLSTSTSSSGTYTLVPGADDGKTIFELPMIPLPFFSEDGEYIINADGELSGSILDMSTPQSFKVLLTYTDGTKEILVLE